ncbi:TIGR03759 family integrating conjugative element protein [Thiopseudomonas alkaliphila]|uniref:TIGR03759 family integrating conjugative element protein n=1 Tax=Thiopseudomonas alkaliphila TaxID=1697053 RepID=UPI00069ECDBE|nr:TIGR03759 family integrating conjugative element protein [Thiopseudomonas alkaliphila]
MKRLALILGVACSTSLFAAQSITKEVKSNIEDTSSSGSVSNVDLNFTNAQKARLWGLEEAEWERYEAIMKGPRGYWSPGLDPLTALGVEAKTETERMRYATLQVVAEFNRVESELAYQRAYNQAFKQQFPNSILINDTDEQPNFLRHVLPPGQLKEVPITLFVTLNCSACDSVVKKMVTSKKRLDIYVINAATDNEIRTWANKVGIPPEHVQRRQITLNYNKDELKLITGQATTKPEQLPLAFKRVGQAWQKIDL